MKRAIKRIVIVGCMFTSSCTGALNNTEYVRYVQEKEHGLKKTINVGSWEYTFLYKPVDLVVLAESKNAKNLDIDKRKKSLDGTVWFNISFRLTDGMVSPLRYNLSSKEEYDRRLHYFLNEAEHSIHLLYGGTDTLKQIGYLFENNYNLTPQETMVVGFELPDGQHTPQKNMQIAYADNVFKNGIIKVLFKENDIKNIPNLKY